MQARRGGKQKKQAQGNFFSLELAGEHLPAAASADRLPSGRARKIKAGADRLPASRAQNRPEGESKINKICYLTKFFNLRPFGGACDDF